MFDNYVLCDKGVKNVEKDGKVVGFEMKTFLSYYRGIPVSMVNDIKVKVDGEEVERNKIKFSVDGEDFFTLDEMETVTTYKWEYGVEATVFVEKEGGLAKGNHEITLNQIIRTPYIPVPLDGINTRTFEIA